MVRSFTTALLLAALILAACGQGAEDIARNLDEAVEATSTAGRASQTEAEAAASRTICDGLRAYSSEPAAIATAALQDYAEQQEVASSLTLHGIDPAAASRLASAAEAIESSQDAVDVATELGCP